MDDRIVEAARSSFRKRGISGTRMEDVASAVGLARPNLYRYYRSKDDLVFAVLARETAVINRQRRATIPLKGPVGPLVTRSVVAAVQAGRENVYLKMLNDYRNLVYTSNLMTGEKFREVRDRYWHDLFTYGRSRGEVREDISDIEIIDWISAIEFMFLQRTEMFPNLGSIQSHMERFVVPAILRPEAIASEQLSAETA